MCGRELWEISEMTWDAANTRSDDTVAVSVHSPKWDPQLELNFNEWCPDSRLLVHVCLPFMHLFMLK